MSKTIRLIILLMVNLLIININGMADDQTALLTQAKQAYDSGEYNKAINYYQKLLDDGYDNAELFYNLGNSAFKAGQIGEAIAFYRQAAKRAPWDEDINYNLDFARSLIKQPKVNNGPIDIIINKVFLRFSAQQLSLMALIFYLGLMLLGGYFIVKRRHHGGWNWAAAGLGLVFVFFAVLASARLVIDKQVKWGVVVDSQAEARNGPGETYQVGFTVPEGREVRVFSQEDDWLAIGLPQEGYKGWVKSKSIWRE